MGVGHLRDFFEVSALLEKNLPRVYAALSANDADNALMNHQALTKVLCQMLDFSARFDDMKMINPAVQNDLAYYRRVLSRLKRERKAADGEIRDETVDRMSLFYAHASPMTRVVIDTTLQFLASAGVVGLAVYIFYRVMTLRAFFRHPSPEKGFLGLAILVFRAESLLDVFVFMVYPLFYYNIALIVAILLTKQDESLAPKIEKMR